MRDWFLDITCNNTHSNKAKRYVQLSRLYEHTIYNVVLLLTTVVHRVEF